MLIRDFFTTLNENSAELSDIVQARELIGHAMENSNTKQKYFDFLAYLRKKHGVEYSKNVHKRACEFAQDPSRSKGIN
jgi:hypothetical protein